MRLGVWLLIFFALSVSARVAFLWGIPNSTRFYPGAVRVAVISDIPDDRLAEELRVGLGPEYQVLPSDAESAATFMPHFVVVRGEFRPAYLRLAELATGPEFLLDQTTANSAESFPPSRNARVVSPGRMVQEIRSGAARPFGGLIAWGSRQSPSEIDRVYSRMKPVFFKPPAHRWKWLQQTRRKLKTGERLRIILLGDSIVGQTANSGWELLVERRYPGTRIQTVMSVREGTGCWFFKDPARLKLFVLEHAPDLVIIGGISQNDDLESIREVIRGIRKHAGAEILLMTGPFGLMDPKNEKEWAAIRERPAQSYGARLERLAQAEKCSFLDLQRAWGEYIRAAPDGVAAFKRDKVHANERGEQVLGRILEQFFSG